MADETWQELRTKIEGLGSKLKVHLEQENDTADPTTQPGDTRAAFDEMTAKVQDALTSFSNASKDPFIREDMRDIGALLKETLNETYQTVSSTVGEDLGKVLRKTKGDIAADDGSAGPETPDAGSDSA